LEQVGAQTETELKEKKLRVEDALNATKVLTQLGFSKEYLVLYYFGHQNLAFSNTYFWTFRQLLRKE